MAEPILGLRFRPSTMFRQQARQIVVIETDGSLKLELIRIEPCKFLVSRERRMKRSLRIGGMAQRLVNPSDPGQCGRNKLPTLDIRRSALGEFRVILDGPFQERALFGQQFLLRRQVGQRFLAEHVVERGLHAAALCVGVVALGPGGFRFALDAAEQNPRRDGRIDQARRPRPPRAPPRWAGGAST